MQPVLSRPWLLGAVATLVTFLALNIVFNLDPTCWDGWVSSSIGKQGACSHHGGVNKTAGTLAWLVSIIFGLVLGLRQAKKKTSKSYPKQEIATEDSPKNNLNHTVLSPSCPPKPNIEKSLYAPKSISCCPLHGRMVESTDGEYWVCSELSGCDYYFKKTP